VGSALGNATGFGALTGGAVRCRVYGVAGVTPVQVGQMTVFTSVTLALALALMTAAGMGADAPTLARMTGLAPGLLRAIGGAVVAGFAVLMLACRPTATRVQLSARIRIAFTVPARRDLVAELALAVVDVVAAGLALWTLLPHAGAHIGFVQFVTVYAAAM